MIPFNMSECPLSGINLIEASAGTGKTHALAGLVLRLLIEQKLALRQILVITFTKAATEELKRRIRRIVQEARRAFEEGRTENSFFQKCLDKYPSEKERKLIAGHLTLALANFDEAAIYTIHGFCQRILMENAFESGVLFETDFIENQQLLQQEFVEDFWRKKNYENHPAIIRYMMKMGINRQYFLALFKYVQSKTDLKVVPDYLPVSMDELNSLLQELNLSFCKFKEIWQNEKDNIITCLKDNALFESVYGPKTDHIVRQADKVILEENVYLPLNDCFKKLSQEYLQVKTYKGKTTPRHQLFSIAQDICEKAGVIQDMLDHYLLGLKKEFLEALRTEFPKLKQKKNVLYFDDLLLRAHQALRNKGSENLVAILREKYRAVLVDEFQDTDPLQFAILQTVFSGRQENSLLFYIGDPKQAIYSFRGADIFAYLRATATVDHKYTMEENWRSESSLINAINVLFGTPSQAFVYEGIDYNPIRQASEVQLQKLCIAEENQAALQWWFVPGGDDDKPRGVVAARKFISLAVAAEVSRLLHLGRDHKAFIGEKPLTENDIAILVRRNSEAVVFQKILGDAGIPSVIFSAESIFATDDAEDIKRFLLAVTHYENEGYLLSALATSFFAQTAKEIAACHEDDQLLENWRLKFRYYHDLWQTSGFLNMFCVFLDREHVRSRIIAYPDGERRLTNYLHLARELQKAEKEGNLNFGQILRLLGELRQQEQMTGDDEQQQLETDRNCVRIVTIHKSKGLEYPIVFCPFGWENKKKSNDKLPVCFHDENNNWQLTGDLGSTDLGKNKQQYGRELLAENCRLLYVALTRAKNRCYFVWGKIKDTEKSAVSYIFHRNLWANEDKKIQLSSEEMIKQLTAFSNLAPQDINLTILKTESTIKKWSRQEVTEALHFQNFKGGIDESWKIASYSLLTRSHGQDNEESNRLEEYDDTQPSSDIIYDKKAFDNLLSFPHGATSGILLHEILEKVNFAQLKEEETKTLIKETLGKFNYPVQWQKAVSKMLEELAGAKLSPAGLAEFTLSEIAVKNCRKEMEFYFPLAEISARNLMAILEQSELYRKYAKKSQKNEKLKFPPMHGFLKGYIDLIFEYNGKYYLADWKSNYLGDSYESYAPERLERVMLESFYDVQYSIYAVALDQYLKKRVKNYSYEKHFGGIYYFFLRGINAQMGERSGLYFDRLDESVLRQLEKILLVKHR